MKALLILFSILASVYAVESIVPFGSAYHLRPDNFCNSQHYYALTSEYQDQVGGIKSTKVDFSRDFKVKYKYKNTKTDYYENIPADGVALSFFEGELSHLMGGGALGYQGAISKGVSFELDIYINDDKGEYDYHTAVHLDGSRYAQGAMQSIELKEDYSIQVQWKAKTGTFLYYVDGRLMHQYQAPAFKNKKNMSWAITSSTGYYRSKQCICLQAYP